MRICLLAVNGDKDRTGFAGTGMVRDVERFDVQLPGRGDCVYMSCQISQFQFVLSVLALADSPPEGGVFGVAPIAIFLAACFESLTRQMVSCETSAPGDGL